MIFVSVLLLLSSLYSAEASVFRKARESVMDAAAPILEALSRPIAWVQKQVGEVGDYFSTLEQNQALREENAELRQWMEEALRLRESVATLERLTRYYAPPEATPINAFVIGESNDAFSHSMLINIGVSDGAARGQAVLDDQGLVGRIVDVGHRASRVLLLTDVQSRVPVYVEDAGVEGIMVGRTKSRPTITFTAASGPIQFSVGQRVLTSGAGGSLPRGLAVGRIAGEEKGEALVDLYSNYARTRQVHVVNYAFPEFEPAAALPNGEDGPVPLANGRFGGDPLADPDDAPAPRAPEGTEDVD